MRCVSELYRGCLLLILSTLLPSAMTRITKVANDLSVSQPGMPQWAVVTRMARRKILSEGDGPAAHDKWSE